MLKNRPLTIFFVAFAAGSVIGLFFNFSPTLPLLISFLSSLLLFFIRKYRVRMSLIFMLAIFLGLSYSSFSQKEIYDKKAENYEKEFEFTGAVRNVEKSTFGLSFTLYVTDCEEADIAGEKVLLYADGDLVKTGDLITCKATLKEPERRDKAEDISYTASGKILSLLPEKASDTGSRIAILRDSISDVIGEIYSKIDEESAAFFKAVIIGDRSGLTNTLNGNFARSGISHLLAISGLHFTVIIMSAHLLLAKLLKRKRLCAIISIILGIVYAILSGASPSVVRAAFMCCLYFLTQSLLLANDSFNSFAAALFVMLIFNPYAIFSLSLQLSFLACAGILFISPYISKLISKLRFQKASEILLAPLAYSLAATVFCLPVLIFSFDYISIISPLTNIAVSLLSVPLLFCAVICPMIFAFSESAASVFAYVPIYIYKTLFACAEFAASLRYACVSSYIPGIGYSAILSVSALISGLVFKRQTAIKLIILCLLCACLIIGGAALNYSESFSDGALLAFNDFLSSSAIFYADENISVLIDLCGNGSIAPLALYNGFTHVDYYFLSSYSEASLLRLQKSLPALSIGALVVPSAVSEEYTAERHEEILSLANRKNCDIIIRDYRFELDCPGSICLYSGASLNFSKGFALIIEFEGFRTALFSSADDIELSYAESADLFIASRRLVKSGFNVDVIPVYANEVYCFGSEGNDFAINLLSQYCYAGKTKLYNGDIKFWLDGESASRLD